MLLLANAEETNKVYALITRTYAVPKNRFAKPSWLLTLFPPNQTFIPLSRYVRT